MASHWLFDDVGSVAEAWLAVSDRAAEPASVCSRFVSGMTKVVYDVEKLECEMRRM